MRKFNLVVIGLCLAFLCLFGIDNKNYNVSSIIYTESNSNLIGKEVKLNGFYGTFHVLGTDGKKVRLLLHDIFGKYNYNSSADGYIPVAFENSALYSSLMNMKGDFKEAIEYFGGDTSILEMDLPTIEEFYNLGYFDKGFSIMSIGDQKIKIDDYKVNSNTPEWLFDVIDEKGCWFTKSISKNDQIYTVCKIIYNTGEVNYVGTRSAYYGQYDFEYYGSSIRPVVETSVYNLVSDDDIKAYISSLSSSDNDKKDDSSNNGDNAQFVKVSSTGMNAEIIFTVVGISIILIAGIVIYVIVKEKRSKK